MGSGYTIGQLAGAAGVPSSTVRYYERAGLVRPGMRTESNYRVYDDAALERLLFIRAAQGIGFTLVDIMVLLDFRDGRTAPCKEVQTLIETRLSDLERRSRELEHVGTVLRSSLRMCRRAERSGKCQVIERLKAASSPAAARSSRAARGRNPRTKNP